MSQNKKLPSRTQKKELSEKSKKETLILIACCFVFMLVYFSAVNIPVPIISFIVTGLYMLGLGVFVIVYIAYNYAFTRKDVTMQMLPDDWSDEKKTEYIQKGIDRKQKSRWMIFIIFPLIVTFIVDILYLFVWESWLYQLFSK